MLSGPHGAEVFGVSRRTRSEEIHSCPLTDKTFLYLEVEPAESARPEVQATTITLKGTPARREESMGLKTKSNSNV
jgi:hypothetical protein